MNKVTATGICFLGFLTASCEDSIVDNSSVIAGNNSGAIERSVARYYRVNLNNGGGAKCYQEPNEMSELLVTLANSSKVRLVSHRTGMVRNSGRYWLHIHPEKYPNIRCFMATQNLVPVPEY